MDVHDKFYGCHDHPKMSLLRFITDLSQMYVANCNTPACNELHSFPVILIKYANAAGS